MLRPATNAVSDGVRIYWAPSLRVTPTNGLMVVSNLVPNFYSVSMEGVPGGFGMAVPWTNAYLNGLTLTTNVPFYSWAELSSWAVAASTNVTVRTNGHVYYVSAAGGGGGTGQTNWPWASITNAPAVVTNTQSGVTFGVQTNRVGDGDALALAVRGEDGIDALWDITPNAIEGKTPNGDVMISIMSGGGNVNMAGDLEARRVFADGAGVTNLAWTNITGTLPPLRLVTNLTVIPGVLVSDGTNVYLAASVPLAALPSGLVTNGATWTVSFTNPAAANQGCTFGVNGTNFWFTVNAGGANTLVASNGYVGIVRVPTTYPLEVAGSAKLYNAGSFLHFAPASGSGNVAIAGVSDGVLRIIDNNGLCTSGGIAFGSIGNFGSTAILSTNWPWLMVGGYSNRVAFRIQAGTNSTGSVKTADLDITGTIAATNGVTTGTNGVRFLPATLTPPTPAVIGTNGGQLWISNTVLYWCWSADGVTSNAPVKIAP